MGEDKYYEELKKKIKQAVKEMNDNLGDIGIVNLEFIDDEEDNINHPKHYNHGGIETIDIIKAMLTEEEYRGYLKGNILKYRERAQHKGKPDEDYAKALWYYEALTERELEWL